MVGFRKDIVIKKPFSFPRKHVLDLLLKDILDSDVDEKYFLSDRMSDWVKDRSFIKKPLYKVLDPNVAFTVLASVGRIQRAGLNTYVTEGGRLRQLTPRECLRLMGFTDEFKQVVSDSAMYRQAGNSIVVDVLMHLICSIMDSVDLGG